MASSWAEEGALADMKSRLNKLRIDQSRQKMEDEPTTKKDTLKILQSKFGSPVYDPTSPQQKAYERRCARTGRRKSIEFEDLYLTKGSGLLHHPTISSIPGSPKSRPSSSSPRKHPLLRGSSALDHSGHLPASPTRVRKTSDPSSYYRKLDHASGNGHSKVRHGVSDHGGLATHKGQGENEGHKGHKGLLGVIVTEEDKKIIDQKLAALGGSEDAVHHSPQQRRRKISAPSKTSSKQY